MSRPKPSFDTMRNRFWSKVLKGEGCWEWQGEKIRGGYGRIQFRPYRFITHRFSWILEYGVIPVGLQVCHKCDNPKCVRPEHLFLGTAKDNAQDRNQKGRANCPHKLSKANVLEIRKRLSLGESGSALGREFGVLRTTIHAIKIGRNWKSLAA